MSMSEYFFILIEASICMVIINALTLYVSRKGLIAKILLMTSPAIAASFLLGIMFAEFGFTVITGIIFFVVSLAVSLGFIWMVCRGLINPINAVAEVSGEIAQGNLNQQLTFESKDEVGNMVSAMQEMMSYLRELAGVIHRLAQEDLTVAVNPRSERDVLGQALRQMIANLGHLVGQVADNAHAVSNASAHLAETADQTWRVTAQISGASQEQAEQVGQAQAIAQQMAAAIEQVSGGVEQGAGGALDAARTAREGAAQVEASLVGMSSIKAKVGVSAQRVAEMGEYSSQVGRIVATIADIASQTNLLALNAAIEAARAEGQAHKLVEYLLDQHMIIQARLLTELLQGGQTQNWTPQFWSQLAQRAGIDNICITDGDGVVVFSDQSGLLGFRFSDEPQAQTYPFRRLLQQRNGVYCQATQPRSVDRQIFKYVGVSRQDTPGIVQVGFRADTLRSFQLQVGGFAVVASEVRQLAERSGQATKEIAGLIKNMQRTIAEAVAAMHEGSQEMETGMSRASEAGQALKNILQAVEGVSRQMETVAASTRQITTSAGTLTEAMDGISAVVEMNAAATEEMSAQAQEVNDSAQGLQQMARSLQEVIEQFKLDRHQVGTLAEVSFVGPLAQVGQASGPAEALPLVEMAA